MPTYSEETLDFDLRSDRPQWILSNFGAAKHEPNLFFGDDVSQEEMRWKSVQAIKNGNGQSYVSVSD
jgi:nucleoporin NUP42